MSRKWIQLLALEALGLLILVNVLPAWNKTATPAWQPVTQWRVENTPAPRLAPQSMTRVQGLRAPDSIPTPPPPQFYAPKFEGSAPLNDLDRGEYVRRRLARTSSDFTAVVNQALRSSLPPDWEGETVASNRNSRYASESWPRR